VPIVAAKDRFVGGVGSALNTAAAFRKGSAGTAAERADAGVRLAGGAIPAKLPDALFAPEAGSWPGGFNDQACPGLEVSENTRASFGLFDVVDVTADS